MNELATSVKWRRWRATAEVTGRIATRWLITNLDFIQFLISGIRRNVFSSMTKFERSHSDCSTTIEMRTYITVTNRKMRKSPIRNTSVRWCLLFNSKFSFISIMICASCSHSTEKWNIPERSTWEDVPYKLVFIRSSFAFLFRRNVFHSFPTWWNSLRWNE